MIDYEINPALYTQDLRFSDSRQNSPVEKLGLVFGWYCYCMVVKRCLVFFDSGTQGSSFRPLRALCNAETESCSFCRSTVWFGGKEDWPAFSSRKNWSEYKWNGNWSVRPCLLFGELTNKTDSRDLVIPCGIAREVKHHVYVKRQTRICTTWPSFPFTCRLLFIISTQKLAVSLKFLSIRIVWSCFYLLVLYFEKFPTWIRRLPFAVYVKHNPSTVNS